MIGISIGYLKKLQTKSGLFRASAENVKTGYDRIWIRDNLYISLAFESYNDTNTVKDIYYGLFDLFKKYEWKIDEVIAKKPIEDYKFLHPLYTDNLEEIKGGWGWKQNDTIGGFLFHVGRLINKKIISLRDKKDEDILKKLVLYLESIKYWEDEDNGIWEENKEIHSSSLGACISGLKLIKNIVYVNDDLIKYGENKLFSQLPRESNEKRVDLSLLSLIYPYNLLNQQDSLKIIKNIEKYLLRNKGIIRYENDKYYYEEGIEASWTMGLPWLALCYYSLGDIHNFKFYLDKTMDSIDDEIKLPELYIKDSIPNENNPLGWSQSLLVVALTI